MKTSQAQKDATAIFVDRQKLGVLRPKIAVFPKNLAVRVKTGYEIEIPRPRG